MDSSTRDYPKWVGQDRHSQQPAHSYNTVLLGVVGYALVCLLALFANNNRDVLYGSVESGDFNEESNSGDYLNLNWDFIGTSGSAHVDSYVRKVEGSKLFAFKGIVVIDEHISDVMRTFGSVSTTPEWADMLQIMETLPVENASAETPAEATVPAQKKNVFGSLWNKIKSIRPKKQSDVDTNYAADDGDNILLHRAYTPATIKTNLFGGTTTVPASTTTNLSDIVYQYYTLPWPIAPREFLFHREFRLYPATSTVTADYTSIHDDRHPLPSVSRPQLTPLGAPISKHTIRAESPFAHWVFQDLDVYCTQRTTSQQNNNVRTQEAQICEEVALQRAETAYLHSQNNHHDPNTRHRTTHEEDSARRKRRTFVSIETLVDNKGSLPPWLVNYVQRYGFLAPVIAGLCASCCVYASISFYYLMFARNKKPPRLSFFIYLCLLFLFVTVLFPFRSWPSKTLSAFAASVQRQTSADNRNNNKVLTSSNESGGINNVVQYLSTW